MKFYTGGYNSILYKPNSFRELIPKIAENLRKIRLNHDFDAIAVVGKSGVTVGFALQMITDEFPIMAVAKKGEGNHGQIVEARVNLDIEKYIILDDFLATGRTAKHVIDTVKAYSNDFPNYGPAPVCIGAACYEITDKPRVPYIKDFKKDHGVDLEIKIFSALNHVETL